MTPRTAARQASLSITNSWSLLKLMSIISVMPSNHLILCHSLLFLPSIFPSIRAFSSESVLCTRWPKYWIFSYSINGKNRICLPPCSSKAHSSLLFPIAVNATIIYQLFKLETWTSSLTPPLWPPPHCNRILATIVSLCCCCCCCC